MIVIAPHLHIFPRALDLRWLRYTLALLAIPMIMANMHTLIDNSASRVLPWLSWSLNILFGLLLLIYAAHMLICRLQCSLFDLVVIVAFAGNFLGVFLTVPGLRPLILQLLPAAMGWVLMGAVEGIIYARILDSRSQTKRALLLLFAWTQYLCLPLLMVGGVLFLAKADRAENILGGDFMSCRYPFIIASLVILVVSIKVHRKIHAAAKARHTA